jgi:hypothetical protein
VAPNLMGDIVMTLQKRVLVASMLAVWVGMVLACAGGGTNSGTPQREVEPPAPTKPIEPPKPPTETEDEVNRRFAVLERERREHEAELGRRFADDTVAATANIERMLEKEPLSQSEKRCIRGCIKKGWVPTSSLNLDKPLRDGDMGVPYCLAFAGGSRKMVVDRITGSDEMVVSNGKLWIKGVSTAGLIDLASLGNKPGLPSLIELKEAFFMEGTKTCKTGSGREMTMPCLFAIDLKKVELALGSDEVKKLVSAKIKYQQAKALSARRAEEQRRQKSLAIDTAKGEWKKYEVAKAQADEERKTISYEILKQIPRGDRKLIIDVLVSERATKQEILKLAGNLRREYAGKYGVITIYDSRVASQRHHDESYPEKELFLHWLVELADWDEGKEIKWLAPERDH